MKHPDDTTAVIDRLKNALDTETITVLDLDSLRALLDELSTQLNAGGAAAASLEVLRRDYIRRIAGMLKAIAASGMSRVALKETLDDIDSLESLTAARLVERYQAVAARFRDHFPTSFGPLRASGHRGK